jgi:hypothetical protein
LATDSASLEAAAAAASVCAVNGLHNKLNNKKLWQKPGKRIAGIRGRGSEALLYRRQQGKENCRAEAGLRELGALAATRYASP